MLLQYFTYFYNCYYIIIMCYYYCYYLIITCYYCKNDLLFYSSNNGPSITGIMNSLLHIITRSIMGNNGFHYYPLLTSPS